MVRCYQRELCSEMYNWVLHVLAWRPVIDRVVVELYKTNEGCIVGGKILILVPQDFVILVLVPQFTKF